MSASFLRALERPTAIRNWGYEAVQSRISQARSRRPSLSALKSTIPFFSSLHTVRGSVISSYGKHLYLHFGSVAVPKLRSQSQAAELSVPAVALLSSALVSNHTLPYVLHVAAVTLLFVLHLQCVWHRTPVSRTLLEQIESLFGVNPPQKFPDRKVLTVLHPAAIV